MAMPLKQLDRTHELALQFSTMRNERQAELKAIEEDLMDAKLLWKTMGGSLTGTGSTIYLLISRALAKIKEVN